MSKKRRQFHVSRHQQRLYRVDLANLETHYVDGRDLGAHKADRDGAFAHAGIDAGAARAENEMSVFWREETQRG